MMQRQIGFHLIEVLVSLLMISVGVIGVMKGQVYLMQQAEFINHQVVAVQHSETVLERFSSHSYRLGSDDNSANSDLNDVTFSVINFDTDIVDSEIAQDQYVTNWQVQVMLYNDLMQPVLKAVKVQTYWYDRQQQKHQVVLHTVFYRDHGFYTPQ